ncbi:MAG: nicotinate-nucleotide--dimethylbenzimidazole phosphoribosyltransferase [Deltaproteobacteria bacterium]|nr:nicotinate-nucleotide--dimethylbenzimidazole phosphoribosyltransferase [Deltaproteobacteria bacterium]
MTAVLDHVIAAISPASEAQAAAAAARLGDPEPGSVAALAIRLAAARHAPRPRIGRKAVVVVLGDHGVADPGIDLGVAHPTAVAARALGAGDTALAEVARRVGAKIVLIDAGMAAAALVPVSAIRVGRGPSADLRTAAAQTPVEVAMSIDAGIALATALADDGLDVLALGQVGLGAELASAAIVAALTGSEASAVARGADDIACVAEALATAGRLGPLDALAAFGGGDTAVLVGLILAAASMDVPILLDDHATSAAALVATRLAPAALGYLVAAHGGTYPAHRKALAALGLVPLFELGLARGEGTGAALGLSMVDAAAALLA